MYKYSTVQASQKGEYSAELLKAHQKLDALYLASPDFGTVGLQLVIHNGKITLIKSHMEESAQA